MSEVYRRRKTLSASPSVPVALPSLFPEVTPARPPPLRRTRPSPQRKFSPREDDYEFFDTVQTFDVSVSAARPGVHSSARPCVPQHWDYAAESGLRWPSSDARPMRAPCRGCEERVRRGDLISGRVHFACVRSISGSSQVTGERLPAFGEDGFGDSRLRGRPVDWSAARKGAYKCDHPGCSHHCSYNPKSEFGKYDDDNDCELNTSDMGLSMLSSRVASVAPPDCNLSLIPPYSSTAKVAADDPGSGDITVAQANRGIDIQGIPWENLPFSREDYRATRLRSESPASRDGSETPPSDMGSEPARHSKFFTFFANTRRVKCSIVHFQLRNLCWAISKHDVLVMQDMSVVQWDAAAKRKAIVLDLSGSTSAAGDHLPMVQISTMIARDDLVIAGGFYGEIVAKNLSSGAILHKDRISHDENSITNAIDLSGNEVMTSNNDCYLRSFDLTTWQRKLQVRFTVPVNHATRQPFGKMVCAVGDDNLVHMLDGETGRRLDELSGHEDHSFATAWHPDGRIFATGSQDKTCRIWDVRNMSEPMRIMVAKTGAVRSLRFDAPGRFLAMAEQKDFVHMYEVRGGTFDTCQEIDLFGEIAGVSFTPGGQGVFIAVSDRAYSSLMEYELKRSKYAFELEA